jgi:hypothetical protein
MDDNQLNLSITGRALKLGDGICLAPCNMPLWILNCCILSLIHS